ncbi:hypothetical protein RJ640_006463 [Escallonia rubra]|uniref:Wall-associated receptor kinase galacturonan-binding domain-containing protein n=1 Tax=Escallonia rubra TaxID=112253 RepID=A0AA88RI43_9ASTE|nr:hypothetical protein RJ640_006463 [Escallonia rubra]
MALLVLSVLLFCVTNSCKAKKIPPCEPSSCGNIQNIACPFQLKGQNPPNQSCYNPYYTDLAIFQLTCQNNVTILTLAPSRNYHVQSINPSRNYHVQSINYTNYSIRLVDPGLRKADCSTTPVHSLSDDDVPLDFYSDTYHASLNKPVVFLECKSRPVSTRYVVAGGGGTCGNASGTYVVLGDMVVSEVESSCTVSKVAWVSSSYGRLMENSSYLDIHGGMAYGFELSFDNYYYYLDCATHCNIFNPSSFRPTSRCKANKIPLCQPSSCGSIQNITCPFQLKGQNPPKQSCYHPYTDQPSFQLTCQNNVTILTLAPSRNYHVQSINYNNNSIRLVDPGLQKADCSTTPVHSLSVSDFPPDFYFDSYLASFNKPGFLECKSRPVSTRYVVAGGGGTYGNSSGTYVVLGDMAVSEVEGSCSVSKEAWVSSYNGRLMENSSYLDIHGGMAYGFELSFGYRYYSSCASQICDIFNPSSFRPTSRCKYKFSVLSSISST